MGTVTLLENIQGTVVAIYHSEAEAIAERDRLNADPWIDADTADTDAPYQVITWCVQ